MSGRASQRVGERDVAGLEAFFRAGEADLEQAGAKTGLAGDECSAAGRAGLLAVSIGEERTFFGDAIDVGSLLAHHALVGGGDVPLADVVAPEDEHVGFFGRLLALSGGEGAWEEKEGKSESCEEGAGVHGGSPEAGPELGRRWMILDFGLGEGKRGGPRESAATG